MKEKQSPEKSVRDVETRLRVTEIFYSLQGESSLVGLPTVFVRLTGCPLRCQYCDTTYAFQGGERMLITDLQAKVTAFQCKHVCVTGGEPLAQPGCLSLLTRLCDEGLTVSLETSGALSIERVDPRVLIVMDLKTPDSRECDQNLWSNLAYLKTTDQIKFVICSHEDYRWACEVMKTHHLTSELLFSPSDGQMNPTELADWIVRDRLPVRFQLQLHKILWNDAKGR